MTSLAVVALVAAGSAAVPWHTDLAAGLRGLWTRRAAVEIAVPPSTAPGEPVEFSLPALAGARAEEVRVVDGDGVELLFDLRDAAGRPRRVGEVAADDRWTVPSPAGGEVRRLLVYWSNPRALAVPEMFEAGLRNGGAEQGRVSPDVWRAAFTDALHRAEWRAGEGRGGGFALVVETATGAPPAWVQWQQSKLSVIPGRAYEFSGWVRARDVEGGAGWFVHVHGPEGLLLNRHADIGRGTRDWTRVSVSFTAPSGATHATVGTLLRGAGRAWYDDADFRPVVDRRPAVLRVETETLPEPTPAAAPGGFRDGEVVAARIRAVLESAEPRPTVLLADLRPVGGHWFGGNPQGRARLVDAAGAEMPAPIRVGAHVAFLAPATAQRRVGEWIVYLHREAGTSSSAPFNALGSSNLAPPLWAGDADAPGPDWKFTGDATLCRARAGRDGSERWLEFTVPAAHSNRWTGWVSKPIPIRPGRTYLLAGLIGAEGAAAGAVVHAHLRRADGRLTSTHAYQSTSPGASHIGWTLSSSMFQAPPDAASVTLHLTTDRPGLVRHEAVALAEAAPAFVDRVWVPNAGSGPEMRVWPADPLVKIFQDDPPPAQTARAVEVRCARGETEPFQLVVFAGGRARGVRVETAAVRGPAGVAAPSIEVFKVGYVPVDHPAAYFRIDAPEPGVRMKPGRDGVTDGWADEWPDPLIPTREAEVPANRQQPFWFLVRTPANAAPGVYRSDVTFLDGDAPAARVPVSIEVLPPVLPARPTLKVLFDLRTGPGGDYGSGLAQPGEAQRRAWLRFLADHRVGINAIQPEPVFRWRDGAIEMDAAGYEAEAALCFDELRMSVAYTPRFFYSFGWADRTRPAFGFEPLTPDYERAMAAALRAFADRMRARGWHDRFLHYISDEPHFQHEFVVEQMRRLCAMFHGSGAGFPIYSSTWRHCAAWDDALDVWGVGQYGCFPVAEMERLRAAGRALMFTCDGQMAIDTPYLATERLLPYYCFRHGAIGYEFWGVSWWTFDPWRFGWHTYIRQSDDGARHYYVRYPNGDGYLTYPGEAVGLEGPISSIRMEQVRQGIEDYELLRMLAERGDVDGAAERALAAARDLAPIPNAGGLRSLSILPSPAAVHETRARVLAALTADSTR